MAQGSQMAPKNMDGSNNTDSLTESESDSEQSDDISARDRDLNLDYILNELGCSNAKIRKEPKFLEQFLLYKAVTDGSLPKLLFIDIKIFRHICYDIFHDIFYDVPEPEVSSKRQIKEVVEQCL